MSGLLSIRDLEDSLHRSRGWFYARMRDGDFPAPIKLGRRSVWRQADIDAWIDRQARGKSRDGEVRP